jgi:hypothetical protein
VIDWIGRHVLRHVGAALFLLVLVMLAVHDPTFLVRLTETIALFFLKTAEAIAAIVARLAHAGKSTSN